MSARAIFQDSSSDEDGAAEKVENPQEKEKAPETEGTTQKDEEDTEEAPESNQPSSTSADKDNGDKADKDNDDKAASVSESQETTARQQTQQSSSSNRLVIGDDSDEDDDAEFDDGGAVVGSSAPEKPKKSQGVAGDGAFPNMSSEGNDEDEEMDEAGGVSPKADMPPRPPQRMIVLEADRPSDGVNLHMTKLPNVVAIQPEAFDQGNYNASQEEEQYLGYVPNMIRWRYKRNNSGERMRNDDGNLIRESNSRIVQWEDGSYTLHIGNEAFEVDVVDSRDKGGFTGLNGYFYMSQKATFKAGNDDDADGEEKATSGGTVLECMGSIASRLVARPSSLQSAAHKSLTVAIRKKVHTKTAKISEYVTEEDPEKAKQERIRDNLDADRIQSRKRATQNRSRYRTPGMNKSFLEDEDEDGYDGTNLSALKRRSMEDDMDDYGDDSDDDYDETFRTRNSRKRPRRQQEEEEEEDEEEMVFGEESDEDNVPIVKAHTKKRTHQAVLEDDDDD